MRLKVALHGEMPAVRTITDLWPAADWYEREVWDMFGIGFDGHPHLRASSCRPGGRATRCARSHPARGTELGPLRDAPGAAEEWQEELRLPARGVGPAKRRRDPEVMFLNIGPQHGGTHGVVRVIVGLRDEEIVACVPDIGYHHRGAEKMGERQTWHTFIPYTDRIDYLGGVVNNLAYVLAVEKLAGIEVPDRAQVIRVMLGELFRITSHLVFYGTFAQDIGALSPVFYMFSDRERILDIIGRPSAAAACTPTGSASAAWPRTCPTAGSRLVRDFLDYLPPRLDEYDRPGHGQPHLQGAHRGRGRAQRRRGHRVGRHRPQPARRRLTGTCARSAPTRGYDQFEFEVPLGRPATATTASRCTRGDPPEPAHHRPVPRAHAGRPLQGRPPAGDAAAQGAGTMHDIETLITTSWA